MAWVKRNLFFVISVVIGLLLTGYCGYLLMSTLDANASVRDEYNTTLSTLQQLQSSQPFPSTENIQVAKEDSEAARQFLVDFKKHFASFPPPRMLDEKGFSTYLKDSLVQFRSDATNAGIGLEPDFGFAFSSLKGKLNYPAANIEPWMLQLEEIGAILNILYDAKINHLDDIKRVPVSIDDASASDCFPDNFMTNQLGIFTPFRVTFRGFSTEIAAVLKGFASASNCFIVKSVVVVPDTTSVDQQKTAQTTTTPQPTMTRQLQSYAMPNYRRGGTTPGAPAPRARVQAQMTAASAAAAASTASGPLTTVLTENPLTVTIVVDAVKLKAER